MMYFNERGGFAEESCAHRRVLAHGSKAVSAFILLWSAFKVPSCK
jgi:hypothetical protein